MKAIISKHLLLTLKYDQVLKISKFMDWNTDFHQ